MCKYCKGKKVIGNFETNVGKIELFIEPGYGYSEIAINSYETDDYGFEDLTINGNIKINFCPMCGRKLNL